MLKTFTLKNGLKVASYAIPQMKSAFLTISVKAGSIFDKPETSGAAHYMEHILVQGTPSFPTVDKLSEFIESMAGSYNATTFTQSIRFNMSAPAAYLDQMLKIAGEVFFEPLFEESEIEKERNAVMEEIRSREDTLWYKNNQFFDKIRFKKGHPLLLDPGGTQEAVSKMKKADLVSYWKLFFDPSNAYVVIVGGFDQPQAKSLVEKYLSEYKKEKAFPGFLKLSNDDMSNRQIAIRNDPDLQTCYLDISWPSISDDAPIETRVVQGIIRSILGNLNSSRLYRLLRQQKGLVYHVGFGSASYQGFGYCYITSQVVKDLLEEVIDLITKEIVKFIKTGPTEDELNFAKNYLANRTFMQFDHPSAIASWIEGDLIWEDKIYTADEYVKLIERVDKKAVMSFMKKYWDFAKLNVTVQGPLSNSSQNKQKFAQITKLLR